MQFELDNLGIKALYQYTFSVPTGTGIISGYFIDHQGLTYNTTLTLSASATSLTTLYGSAIPSNYISLVIVATGTILIGADGRIDGSINNTTDWPTPKQLSINAGTYRLSGRNTIAENVFQTLSGIEDNNYQSVELVVGGKLLSSTNPLPIQGRTSSVTVTPTITAAAYTTGNEVGPLLVFPGAVDGVSGILQSIYITCKTTQTCSFKLYLFNSNPTNTTWADKTAPSINSADIPFLIGVYTLSNADSGLGTETTWTLDSIGKAVVLTSTTLYGILVVTGTPTFSTTSAISVTINVKKD